MSDAHGHVLLVDDDRQTRLKMVRDIESGGYSVSAAEGGRQALDMLKSTPFDLVLLDILMPDLDGYGVLADMKAHPTLRNIPVIVISALDDSESIEKCMQMGAADYLTKPVDSVTLNARIGKSLAK